MSYQLIKELGKGKDAVTYLIKKGNNRYAIKIFKSHVKPEDVEKEAKMLEKLKPYRITPEIYTYSIS